MRVLKWVLRVLVVLAALVPLSVLGIYVWMLGGLPDYTESRRVDGLRGPVQIMRDDNAVPHIFAGSDADAYFGLGYMHAQDRLWQMDLQRRIGAGRLSELRFLAEAAQPMDRFMRTIGAYRLAEESFQHLSPPVQDALISYAAGVNAAIARKGRRLPPEFYILGYRPEPWTPADSLVWGKLMAFQLSHNHREELLRASLIEAVGLDGLLDLLPDANDRLVSLGAALPAGQSGPAGAALEEEALALPVLRALLESLPMLGPDRASNAWVLSGEHTESGRPLLVNDPHLGLTAPILWYLARLQTPTLTVVGATVPGVPFHMLGHNESIAWGLTTSGGDVQDLFVERLDPDDPDRYLTPFGSQPFTIRQEVLSPRGAEPITLTVRETRHGPVLSDINDEMAALAGEGYAVALAFPALIPNDTTPEALYLLNRARDWDDIQELLPYWIAPQQNVFYADVEGNIGLFTPGRMPIRAAGDGRLPAPGWTGAQDWVGFVPPDEVPQSYNPPDGRLFNANNPVVGQDYPHHFGNGYEEPYRALRLQELLEAQDRHTVEGSLDILMDSVSVAARELLPHMLSVRAEAPQAADALGLLRRWDFVMDRERPEPLIFSMWLRELNRALFAERLGEAFDSYWGLRASVVQDILTRRQGWCQPDGGFGPREGDCQAVLRDSLDAALAWLNQNHGADIDGWRWGDAHIAPFTHQIFSRVPVVGTLIDLSIETDGSHYTLNRGGTTLRNEDTPWHHVHGAGFRAVYDLGDLRNSRFIIATGQSGHPMSNRFGDMVRRWRDGEAFPIVGTPSDLAELGLGTLTLRPGD